MTLDVLVTNRHAWIKTPDFPLEDLESYWSYLHPAKFFVRRARPGWDGVVRLYKGNKIPSGLFWATRKTIEEQEKIKFRIERQIDPTPQKETYPTSDRDYQNECVEAMLRGTKRGGGTILAATGSGKTWITGVFFSAVEGNCVFIVDQLVLMRQAKKELEAVLGEEVGIIGESIFNPRRVTVATIQTIHKIAKVKKSAKKRELNRWAKKLDVMIIDEIHEQMSRRNFWVIEAIKPKAVFGLTASLQMQKKPVRLKVWAISGPVIFEFPLVEGQRQKVLSKGIAVRVQILNRCKTSEQKARRYSGCYEDKIIFNEYRNEVIESIAYEAIRRGYYVCILVTRIRHLEKLSERMDYIPHKVVSGTFGGKQIKVEDRMKSKDRFEKGKIRLIIANQVFKKGVDIKRLDCVIDAAAGASENDAIQKFGRGIRKHQDKEGLLHFDIADFDPRNQSNYFRKASKKRARALKRTGIKVYKFVWNEDGTESEAVDWAEKVLQR